VTIGLCVRNSEKTIRNAVNSLIDQCYPHKCIDIIVVDGKSKDATLTIIDEILTNTDMRNRIYSDEGKGLGLARQIVVEKACGDYIVFIDSDVVLPRDFLRKQVDFVEKNPAIGAAIPECEYMNLGKSLPADIQDLLLSMVKNISSNAAFRTQALREIGGFDKLIKGASEDIDVAFRLKRAGWNVVPNPNAKFYQIREETLRDIHARYIWYGYGDHFTHHKHRSLIDVAYRLPPPYVIWGVKLSLKAYAKYHTKKAFLIPLLCLLASTSWCLGFIGAHMDEYGHQQSRVH
jgi:glycosyltransferase involved in cell wall biosynthesis